MNQVVYTGQLPGNDGFMIMVSGNRQACLEHLKNKGCTEYVVMPSGNLMGKIE